jgi:alpha-galactosidase
VGHEVSSSGGLDVLAKPLANGDVAVALFNETGSAATISTTGTISASVPAHGTVMYRAAGGTSSGGGSSGEVHAVGAGKCLDAFNNQTTPGTKVEIWSCNGQSNQQWTLG